MKYYFLKYRIRPQLCICAHDHPNVNTLAHVHHGFCKCVPIYPQNVYEINPAQCGRKPANNAKAVNPADKCTVAAECS